MNSDRWLRVALPLLGLAILAAGWFIWRSATNPSIGVTDEEQRFRQMEEWAKRNGRDLRQDPMTAPLYYKYHPEVKPPGGVIPQPGNNLTPGLRPGT